MEAVDLFETGGLSKAEIGRRLVVSHQTVSDWHALWRDGGRDALRAAGRAGRKAKLTAEQMETRADVTLEKQGDGFAITSVHLTLSAKIPGADKVKFEELAGKAKAGCPVSKLFNTKITLEAKLL